jgi:CsoR family transcriptional regulator, copper-sensing transcriptional repressor
METSESKKEVLNRLRSAAGHLNGIVRMVEEDQYCIDVLSQISAVQAALNKVGLQVLDDHMHHCVTEAIRSDDPDERERVLAEIRDVFAARSKL